MNDNDYKRFLEGLAKLTLETGVGIGGCGCCGSPFLFRIDATQNGHYKSTNGGENTEHITWVKNGS